VDFHGARRTNATHVSGTDREARLFRKGLGKEAKLCYMGNVLMENRHGLAADGLLNQATGTAERDAAREMVRQIPPTAGLTLGGDKNYDTRNFVDFLQQGGAAPQVARKTAARPWPKKPLAISVTPSVNGSGNWWNKSSAG